MATVQKRLADACFVDASGNMRASAFWQANTAADYDEIGFDILIQRIMCFEIAILHPPDRTLGADIGIII